MKNTDFKKKLSDTPGVYLFKKGRIILYVGKATSLKDRVKSYFSNDLLQTRGPLLVKMVQESSTIHHIKTDSVLEALILEANLIKKHQPYYNTKEKDNKSFNYIVITKENFPRVLILRGREIFSTAPARGLATPPYLRRGFEGLTAVFGPFTNSAQLKEAIKIIRKIFPFRDKCNLNQKRPCFNYQINLCPGVCIGSISQKDYQKNVKNVQLFFEGKKSQKIKNLKKEMSLFAKKCEFEKAGKWRNKIFALNHIQDVALIRVENNFPRNYSLHLTEDLIVPRVVSGEIMRFEAYDIAHLSGTNNVGVMVIGELINGEWNFKKSDYRKFKINDSKNSDTSALREILERRLRHTEWPASDLIILDGGMAQLNVAKIFLHREKRTDTSLCLTEDLIAPKSVSSLFPEIVAVTKNSHHKPKAILGPENLIKKYKKEIFSLNNEAHRFAIAFHRQKRNAII